MAKNTKLELSYLVPAAYRGRLVYGKDFAASDNLEPWDEQAIKDRLEDCQELRGYFVDVMHNIAPSRGNRPFKTVIRVTPAKKRNPYGPDMLVHAGHAIQKVGGRYAVQPYGRDFATLPAAKSWIERHVAREMREPTRNPGPRGEPDIAALLGWPGYSAFGRAVYKHPSRAGISVQQKPSGFILHVGGDHFGPYKTAREAIRRFEEGLFAPGSGGATTPEFERYLKGGPTVKNPRGFKSFVVDFDVRGGADAKRAVQTIISRWVGKKKFAHAGHLSAAFASEDDARHALTAAAGQGIPASGVEKPGRRQLVAYPQRKKNPAANRGKPTPWVSTPFHAPTWILTSRAGIKMAAEDAEWCRLQGYPVQGAEDSLRGYVMDARRAGATNSEIEAWKLAGEHTARRNFKAEQVRAKVNPKGNFKRKNPKRGEVDELHVRFNGTAGYHALPATEANIAKVGTPEGVAYLRDWGKRLLGRNVHTVDVELVKLGSHKGKRMLHADEWTNWHPQRVNPKRNPLGGPLTITHEGDALIIKHIGNPRRTR